MEHNAPAVCSFHVKHAVSDEEIKNYRELAFRKVQTHADLDIWPFDPK